MRLAKKRDERIGAWVAAWSLIAAAVCSACSSGSPAVTASVSTAQACADNAHARCTQLQTCSATDLALRYGTENDCETRETFNCTMSLAAPLNGNTPAALESCAQAYANWACPDYLDNEKVPAACKQQLGPVINGGACAIDGQCESGFCAIAPGNACGSCAALPKANASCAELLSCGPSLACTTDTVECVPFGVRGAACGKGALCGAGLSCVGADEATNTQGACRDAIEAMGSPCDATGKTAPECDLSNGLVCNTMTNTCQAFVVAAAGEACGADVTGQPVDCAANGACMGVTSSMPGTCAPAAADGAPCDLVGGPSCIIPARCIAGTCQYSGAQSCR